MHEIHMFSQEVDCLEKYRIMNRTDLEIESFETNYFYQKHFITYKTPKPEE